MPLRVKNIYTFEIEVLGMGLIITLFRINDYIFNLCKDQTLFARKCCNLIKLRS